MNKQILTETPDTLLVFSLTMIFLPRNLHFNDHQQAIRRNTKVCLCGMLSHYSPYYTYQGPQPGKTYHSRNLSFAHALKENFSSTRNKEIRAVKTVESDGELKVLVVIAFLSLVPPKKENFHFSFVREKKYRQRPN